tara:strand:- start:379 stop:972 length:594 start_codon:yes stop_codon:yes gene_type:complete
MHDFFENHTINLVIMDINLPGKNGLILAREVRDRKNIGLIFLTGRDNDVDRILGLEIGADDYLTKPFNPRELTIRARNLLSRTTSSTEDDDLPSRVSFNGWTLDGDSRSLIAPSGNEFRLPRSEFRALHLFLSNPGKILTREQLIMEMTGRELRPNDRTVDVTIRRIRKHFESEPNEEELIVTIHGEGYRFCGSVDS